MQSTILLLPGHPLFDITLAYPPPNWREVANRDGSTVAFVADCQTGIMRPATRTELIDYLEGGEYDERMEAIDPDAAEDGL